MNISLPQVLAFVVRHWLRILIVGFLLFLSNKKQIDISLQLGQPSAAPARNQPPRLTNEQEKVDLSKQEVSVKKSWTDRLHILGGGQSTSAYQQLQKLPDEQIAAFLERFSDLAKEEQQKYGIPASITLANGLLHSQAGNHPAAVEANNFFNLAVTTDWLGAHKTIGGQAYRTYQNAWTSFRDHSLFITTGSYTHLVKIGKTDYQRWAAALEKQGFGSEKDLAKQLLQVIDEWQLFRLD